MTHWKQSKLVGVLVLLSIDVEFVHWCFWRGV